MARVGGDAFTELLEGLDAPEGASEVADRIARALEDHLGGGKPVHLTTSIGLAHLAPPVSEAGGIGRSPRTRSGAPTPPCSA